MKREFGSYKYYKGEKRNPFSLGDVRRDFWFGEMKHSIQFAEAVLPGRQLSCAKTFPPKDIVSFIRDLFRRRRPFDSLEWVCQY